MAKCRYRQLSPMENFNEEIYVLFIFYFLKYFFLKELIFFSMNKFFNCICESSFTKYPVTFHPGPKISPRKMCSRHSLHPPTPDAYIFEYSNWPRSNEQHSMNRLGFVFIADGRRTMLCWMRDANGPDSIYAKHENNDRKKNRQKKNKQKPKAA